MDDDGWKSRWEGASDREKVVASLILAALPLSILACALAFGASLADPGLLPLGLVGLALLLRAAYIIVKPRIPVKYRKRRIQADPEQRARQAEIRRLRQEGLLVSQPDLARELGVQSPTVRQWCQKLGLEPAHSTGRNYYTVEQADLIRRYGSAGTAQRHEFLQQPRDRPPEHVERPMAGAASIKTARISPKKGKTGALLSVKARIAAKQMRRFFSYNDIFVALLFGSIGLFLLYLGLKASFEARRIASYPVLVGPGFKAMAPGEHAVVVGVLEGNAPREPELLLVAFAHERWDVSGHGTDSSGLWHHLETHVPGLVISLDGDIVHTARSDSKVVMLGSRHEAIYHRGSGVVDKGISDGSRRVIGFKNGDLVTVVGEKDANGTLIPEILYGGELEQLLSERRGFARFTTPAAGICLALVPLAWLAMRLYRRIPVKYRKRRIQADPGRRARQAEVRRLRQEGLLVSQPDLATELGVQSPTVWRWCKMLGLKPAYHAGRNYYTLEQADLIRRYGSADPVQRREILRET
jgi:DNA-binding transcriptional regulator YiaG